MIRLYKKWIIGRHFYDFFNIYLINKDDRIRLHLITSVLEYRLDHDKEIQKEIQKIAKIIEEKFSMILQRKNNQGIKFKEFFIDFYNKNLDNLKKYIEIASLLVSDKSIKFEQFNFDFDNINPAKVLRALTENKKEKQKIEKEINNNDEELERLFQTFLEIYFLSKLEYYFKDNYKYILQNYSNSTFSKIERLSIWQISFVIDLNQFRNKNKKEIQREIDGFLNFIKRISEPDLKIRIYYKNWDKKDISLIDSFLLINDNYNNIFHYFYINSLDLYKEVYPELVSDFSKFIREASIDWEKIDIDLAYESEILGKIKEDNNFIGIEVFLQDNIIDFWPNILFKIYKTINSYWGKVFKINLERFLYVTKQDIKNIISNNKDYKNIIKNEKDLDNFIQNIQQKIIFFINSNIQNFFLNYDRNDTYWFNLNEITLFNLFFTYQVLFWKRDLINDLFILADNNQELFQKIEYLISQNPFSLFYLKFNVNFENETIKSLDKEELDYPIIDNFSYITSKVLDLKKISEIPNNLLVPLRHINIGWQTFEESILSRII